MEKASKPIPPEIAAIKDKLAQHRAKSRIRRLGSRMLGKGYPNPDELRELKLFELGASGRAINHVSKAVLFSGALNKTPVAMFNGGWEVPQKKASIPMPLRTCDGEFYNDASSAQLIIITMLYATKSQQLPDAPTDIAVGLYTPQDKVPTSWKESDNADGLTFFVRSDADPIQPYHELTLTREEIDTMPEVLADGVEQLASSISNNAASIYFAYKPDTAG